MSCSRTQRSDADEVRTRNALRSDNCVTGALFDSVVRVLVFYSTGTTRVLFKKKQQGTITFFSNILIFVASVSSDCSDADSLEPLQFAYTFNM